MAFLFHKTYVCGNGIFRLINFENPKFIPQFQGVNSRKYHFKIEE